MNDLPDECPVTITHALVHVNAALTTLDDPEQVLHDLNIIKVILDRLLELEIQP